MAAVSGDQRGSRQRRQRQHKAPCKRSQKLGDKITALQQLVSPYGKTDTASVLHEAATCIKHLHEQIQILTASYPEFSSSASQQDTGEEDGGATREAFTEDRWRCLGTL
ncbi:unnamed protein product [Miscanthus lutarioriparius]|uniref:BHLH domain-containing protein n=1 Tax=Miscanthus lutarioriparius TaxID=422564 RepID=A0A811RAU0_9POAL|nr:unnamed protein product [Miscanthus lutarioriparius]